MKKKQKIALAATFFLLFVIIAALAGLSGKPHQKVIRIGYEQDSLMTLVKEKENWEKSLKPQHTSIKWIKYPDDSAIYAAMNKKKIDFARVADTVPIFQHKENPKIIYLGAEPPNPNAHGIVVPKQSLIHGVADLKNKKVGYEKLSNEHFLLAQSLEKEHLSLRDIRSVYVPPEQGLEKLKDGSINALVVGEPYLSKALNSGFRKLDVRSLFTSNRDVYVARDDVYQDNTQAFNLIMKKIAKIDGTISADPHGTATLLTEKTDIAHLVWLSTFDNKLSGVSDFFKGMIKDQQSNINELNHFKLIKERYNIKQYIAKTSKS